jgi:outer membrane cobalamin receptor
MYYHLEGTRTTYDGYRPNSDLEQWIYGGKFGINLAERVNLEVIGNYTNKENGVAGPKSASPDITDRQWDRILVAGAGLTMKAKSGTALKVRTSRTDEKLQYRSAFGFSVHESYTDIAEAQADILLGSWNALSLGYEERRDHLDSTDTGKHASDLKAFFLQDELSLGESIIVVAGVRRDDHSQYGEQTSPKVSGRYMNKGTGTIVRVSYGESFRSPTPNDLYSPFMFCPAAFCGIDLVTVGNPNLKPETSKEYEAGFEQPFGQAGQLKFAGFSRKTKDMIIWLKTNPTVTSEHWQPENIGNATVKGYEAEATLKLASTVRLDVNYTYTNPVDESTGNKIPFIPKTQWKGSLSIDVDKRTNLYLEGRAVENYVNPGEPAWKYSVMDAKIVERMAGTASYSGEIFFALMNVFDRKYEVAQNYPMPPRELRGGVTVRF